MIINFNFLSHVLANGPQLFHVMLDRKQFEIIIYSKLFQPSEMETLIFNLHRIDFS